MSEKTPKPFFEPDRFNSPEEVVRITSVPENPHRIPDIIYYLGPTRSGTTAIALWAAGHPEIATSHFQPHKGGLRHGISIIIPPVTDSLAHEGKTKVFMKDTIGPINIEELFDPIRMLVKAGVPEGKITAIVALRDPVQVYSSLTHFVNPETTGHEMSIPFLKLMQEYTIGLYEEYQRREIRTVPFVYNLFGEYGTRNTLSRLLSVSGLDNSHLDLRFDIAAIKTRMVWGEADPQRYPVYYRETIEPTLRAVDGQEFRYISRTVERQGLTPEQIHRIRQACQPGFEEFKNQAKFCLGL